MWATLAFVSALSLAPQQGGLTLVNVRPTYGILGATRPETEDLLPGDIYFVTFDIDGLQNKDGKINYSIGMEFLNDKGKVEFKREPKETEAITTLGGNRLPAFAAAEVGTETPPGKYMLKATVTDHQAKATKELVKEFKVLPKSFGLVRLHLTYLARSDSIPAPPMALVPGQSVLINCSAIGFKRDPNTKQPNIGIEIRILDEKGQPTLKDPFKDEVSKGVPEDLPAIPIALPLELNRSGNFTVELKATDNVSKTTYKVSFPIKVLELK